MKKIALPLVDAVRRSGRLACGAAVLLASPLHAQEDAAAALREVDAEFGGVFAWLPRLYEAKSGGFYACLAAREPRQDRTFGPDIQSTCFAIGYLDAAGLLATAPDAVRSGLVSYLQSRQDPATGYFADPDYPEMKSNERTMGRAVMFAYYSFRMLHASALYPMPGEAPKPSAAAPAPAGPVERVSLVPAAAAPPPVPAFLASTEAFARWLDALPWDSAWTAVDKLGAQANIIKLLPPDIRAQRTDEALAYVAARQDPATGLVQGGSTIVRISGTFKFVMFCHTLQSKMPRAEQAWDAVLDWYRGDADADTIFFLRNPAELLIELQRQTGRKLSPEELLQVIGFSRRELGAFRCRDGGFCTCLKAFHIMPNDLFPGRYPMDRQGDLNGSSSALALRKSLYALANVQPVPPLPAPGRFWDGFPR